MLPCPDLVMNAPAKKNPKDRNLFASLVNARKANVITVTADASRLNRPGSPVWNSGENVAPILAMMVISLVLMFTANVIVGTAAMILGVLIYFTAIRPWILQRVYDRAVEAALTNPHNWDLLWKKGGLIIKLNDAKGLRCEAPRGDWRAFAANHLPRVEIDGVQQYTEFNRNTKSGDLAVATSDLSM